MSRQITDFFSAEKIPTNETEMEASVFSETISEELFQHDENSLAAIPIPDKKRAAMISPLRMPDHSRQILGDPNVPQTPAPTVQFQQHPLKPNLDPRLNRPYMPQTTIISDDENEPTLSDKQRGKKRSLDQAAGDYLGASTPNQHQQHQGAGTAAAAATAAGGMASVADFTDNDNFDELLKQNQQMIVEAQNKVKQQNSRKKKPKDEEEQKEDVIRKKKRAVFQALSELNEAWPEAKLRVTIDIPK